MCQRPLLSSISYLLGGVPGGDIVPSFSPSSLLGKGKKGIKGGHYRQGAGFGGPRFHTPRERLVRRVELPNLNLAGSYQLRVLPGSGIKGGQGCLFTFFPLFWPKEVKTKPLLCLPPPSFLPPPLLSLISLTTENPTRETESFCRSPLHFRHSPGVTAGTEPWAEHCTGAGAQIPASDEWQLLLSPLAEEDTKAPSGEVTLGSLMPRSMLSPTPQATSLLQMRISTKENKMSAKVAKGRNPAPSVP